MFSRRGYSPLIAVCFLTCFFVLYGYIKFNDLAVSLSRKERELSIKEQHEKAIKNQLKVVFEHSEKLNAVLEKEKENNKNLKAALEKNIQECHKNISQSKHEARNRFNALDTDYKMLKVSNEELNTNYMALQQNHVRLSEEQKRLDIETQKEIKTIRDAKDTESISLQDRIQDLYQQKVTLQTQLQQYEGNFRINQDKLKETIAVAQKYQDAVRSHAKQSKQALADLQKCKNGETVLRNKGKADTGATLEELEDADKRLAEIKQNPETITLINPISNHTLDFQMVKEDNNTNTDEVVQRILRGVDTRQEETSEGDTAQMQKRDVVDVTANKTLRELPNRYYPSPTELQYNAKLEELAETRTSFDGNSRNRNVNNRNTYNDVDSKVHITDNVNKAAYVSKLQNELERELESKRNDSEELTNVFSDKKLEKNKPIQSRKNQLNAKIKLNKNDNYNNQAHQLKPPGNLDTNLGNQDAADPPRNQMPIPKQISKADGNGVNGVSHETLSDRYILKAQPINKSGSKNKDSENDVGQNIPEEQKTMLKLLGDKVNNEHVKEVTLEDDENGDQMLDQENPGNDGLIAAGAGEQDDENDQRVGN